MFTLLDRDRDGKVTKDQMSGPLALLFNEFNADKDEFLTVKEVSEGKIPVLLEIILANLMR